MGGRKGGRHIDQDRLAIAIRLGLDPYRLTRFVSLEQLKGCADDDARRVLLRPDKRKPKKGSKGAERA